MGRKGTLTKQRIRAAAFKLFAERGYTKVTMQDICAETGLSKGGLYRHYEDKSQIFADILQELQEEEGDREARGMRQDATATDLLDGYLSQLRQDIGGRTPSIERALYEFCVEHKDDIGELILQSQYQRGEAILRSLIEYGIAKGEFCSADPHGAAAAILFLAEGLRMTGEVMRIPEESLEAVFRQIREMVGIRNEE